MTSPPMARLYPLLLPTVLQLLAVSTGLYPIVTLEKQLPNIIGKLV
jgi:hypothetical protein